VVGALTSGLICWQEAVTVLAVLAVSGACRILIEWQRRLTVIALVTRAPQGTVVEQHDGHEGQTMRVVLGGRSRRPRSEGSG
jgi:hypothetical protein